MLCPLSLAVGGCPVQTSLNPWSLGSTILFASQTSHVWKSCHCAVSVDGVLFHRQLISLHVYLLFPHTHRSLLYWTQWCPTRLIPSCWSWCLALICSVWEGPKLLLLVVMIKLETTVQGSLLHVFPVEVVFGGNVVENGSGLHQLYPINFNHWHLLEHQTPIFGKKKRSRVRCWRNHAV